MRTGYSSKHWHVGAADLESTAIEMCMTGHGHGSLTRL